MDLSSRFEASMKTLGKRLEVMKKKNELSLFQNEILSLESELRELEMHDEQVHREESRDEKPRRHLPDIPFGRRDHVTICELPQLHLNDESSIGAAAEENISRMQSGANDIKVGPVTSTPSASAPKQQDKTSLLTQKSHDKSGAKIKPATFDGTVHWTDYKEYFDACAELNGWTDKEKRTLFSCIFERTGSRGLWKCVIQVQ